MNKKDHDVIAEIIKSNCNLHTRWNILHALANYFEREEIRKKVEWYNNKFQKAVSNYKLKKIKDLASKHKKQFFKNCGVAK